jgi:hypothetical protein
MDEPVGVFRDRWVEDAANERQKHSNLVAASSSPLVAGSAWRAKAHPTKTRDPAVQALQSAKAMGTP